MAKEGTSVTIATVAVTGMGEVQDTPTAYTLLRRLKDFLTGIILAAGSAVIGKVRLVTATGDEVTDDTQNAVRSFRTKAGLLSSGVKTADAQIKSGAGAVWWLTVSDTAAGVVGLADSVGDSATYVWKITIPADGYAHFIFDPPLEFATGIWLDVPTGTPDVIVEYN